METILLSEALIGGLHQTRALTQTDDIYRLNAHLAGYLDQQGPTRFGQLVATTPVPAVARAVLQQMIWNRQVSIDLNRLLTDESIVRTPEQASA